MIQAPYHTTQWIIVNMYMAKKDGGRRARTREKAKIEIEIGDEKRDAQQQPK